MYCVFHAGKKHVDLFFHAYIFSLQTYLHIEGMGLTYFIGFLPKVIFSNQFCFILSFYSFEIWLENSPVREVAGGGGKAFPVPGRDVTNEALPGLE